MPTFLVEHRFFTPDLAGLQSSEALISRFDAEDIAPEGLLWPAVASMPSPRRPLMIQVRFAY